MTRVLLCSTYELGSQPLGCAGPASALLDHGHEVRMADLSLSALEEEDVSWADAVAFSVPMHTAVRLGLKAFRRVRGIDPSLPIAFHGLYATTVLQGNHLKGGDLVTSGEVDEALVEWASDICASHRTSEKVAVRIEIGQTHRGTPSRRLLPYRVGLPGLDRYARFIDSDGEHLVGAIATTEGCNHRCRHCPVPVVYEGRSRANDLDSAMGDIDQLVAMGAEHLHFADPDFLNRPGHAMATVDRLSERHPSLTFDITVKVSHLIRHEALWLRFSERGLRFVTSAFESTSDVVLGRLDKGHTASDLPRAVSILRSAGIEPRPSFLPFTPWTTRDDVIELFNFVARYDLIENVDAVQYAVRLLLPPGSLLLRDPDPVLASSLGDFDPDGVAVSWRAGDGVLDELALAIASRCEQAAARDEDAKTTYLALRAMAHDALCAFDDGVPDPLGPLGPQGVSRARLSEAWFCCAEPTENQRAIIG